MKLKEAYFVEVGVLLTEADEEMSCYNEVYDQQYGYYDENQFFTADKDKAIAYVKNYVNNGNDSTYGLVSGTLVAEDTDLDNYELSNATYDPRDVIYSCRKDRDTMKENFVITDMHGNGSING